jgi:hypothetical protein
VKDCNMQTVFLSKRNLESLLSKLERKVNGEETACTLIKQRNPFDKHQQSVPSIAVTAITDEEAYASRDAGAVHPKDEIKLGGSMYFTRERSLRKKIYLAFVRLQNKMGDLKIFFSDLKNPKNVIKLRKLDRGWQETDTVIEEAVFQSVFDFFRNQQPFHLYTSTPYETNPTIERHIELLHACGDIDYRDEWRKLLEIAHKWNTGFYSIDPAQVWINTNGAVEFKIDAQQKFSAEVQADLIFVITHRNLLWT